MSASLVGSEMCIRDRPPPPRCLATPPPPRSLAGSGRARARDGARGRWDERWAPQLLRVEPVRARSR
eukprot:15458333-Alexandrium_andersonii.AAC.1